MNSIRFRAMPAAQFGEFKQGQTVEAVEGFVYGPHAALLVGDYYKSGDLFEVKHNLKGYLVLSPENTDKRLRINEYDDGDKFKLVEPKE